MTKEFGCGRMVTVGDSKAVTTKALMAFRFSLVVQLKKGGEYHAYERFVQYWL
nr:MAG TPA: hypothetical protein [Caudoviricetes sp.]